MSQSATYYSETAETYADQMLKTLTEWFGDDREALEGAMVDEATRVRDEQPALYDHLMETLDGAYGCLACFFLDYYTPEDF